MNKKFKIIGIVIFCLAMTLFFVCREGLEHYLYSKGLTYKPILDGYTLFLPDDYYVSYANDDKLDYMDYLVGATDVQTLIISRLSRCSNDEYIHLSIRDIPIAEITGEPHIYKWGYLYLIESKDDYASFVLQVDRELIFGVTSNISLLDNISISKKIDPN